MRTRYNTRLIHKRRTYTTKEIAGLFGMHVNSVLKWIRKDNLTPITGSGSPYLIYGEELHSFLTKKKQKHKCKLQADEFYCFKCKCARKGIPADTSIVKTEIRIGNKGKCKAYKISKCEVCVTKLFRFLTYQRETADRII
jgi:transposase